MILVYIDRYLAAIKNYYFTVSLTSEMILSSPKKESDILYATPAWSLLIGLSLLGALIFYDKLYYTAEKDQKSLSVGSFRRPVEYFSLYDSATVAKSRKLNHLVGLHAAPTYKGSSKFPLINKEIKALTCCDPHSVGITKSGFWDLPNKNVEWDEWILVDALITPNDRVLEFGARYGTTSCVLSRATGNTGNVVSVEIDESVTNDILKNRDYYECNFHVFMGSVGEYELVVDSKLDYATHSAVAKAGESALPHATIKQIEHKVGYNFNTLLIDCEGCVDFVINPALLEQISLIIIELDGSPKGGYEAVFKSFKEHGFELIWKINDTYDPSQKWSRELRHEAWRKGGIGDKLTCSDYKKKYLYSDDQLKCLSLD